MTIATLASDPVVIATFDRIVALVTSRGSGISLRELGTAHALARALFAGEQERVEEFAAELKVDVEALR